jgi:hypothetical protein
MINNTCAASQNWKKKNTLAPNKSIGERNSRNSFPEFIFSKTFALLVSQILQIHRMG